jgi:urea transport system substrate-binding protein
VIGEHYAPLGRADFTEVAQAIARTAPDIVYNTLNGADNISFFEALTRAGVTANETPVLSFSLSELELSRCPELLVGHLACWSYFRTTDTPENKDLVERFRRRYGDGAILSDPSVTAYAQLHLFKDVAEQAGSLQTADLRRKLLGSQLSLGGEVLDVCENNHVERRASIGEIVSGGEFQIKWRSNRRIAPKPWLGVEEAEPLARGLIVQALRALPQMAEQNSSA